MNGDKKPDIVLCDARNIAWYENRRGRSISSLRTSPSATTSASPCAISWDGKAEIAPVRNGTLAKPATRQVRRCFYYPTRHRTQKRTPYN
ncbi:MAG: hypothetical protein Ct9H300mP7_7250 [Verrucomicrobiota bacterium]|nr:MAG: hypothetical protein Ct9H300mP7_7250 [Verrucomicrobiota bacterium]